MGEWRVSGNESPKERDMKTAAEGSGIGRQAGQIPMKKVDRQGGKEGENEDSGEGKRLEGKGRKGEGRLTGK